MKCPTDKKVILASNSPRRRQLLSGIVPEFSIAESRDINEQYPDSLPAEQVAPFLSQLKAEGYSDLIDNQSVLITADTVVILDNQILGKPASEDDAVHMLSRLSGRTHKVITGVTLKTTEKTHTFSSSTLVDFDVLDEDEIRRYVREFKPFDKAGSYGIQEWIGYRAIKKIDGCFYNVMGLPLNRLYTELKKV